MSSISYDASRDALYTPQKQSCLFTTGEPYDLDALCRSVSMRLRHLGVYIQ